MYASVNLTGDITVEVNASSSKGRNHLNTGLVAIFGVAGGVGFSDQGSGSCSGDAYGWFSTFYRAKPRVPAQVITTWSGYCCTSLYIAKTKKITLPGGPPPTRYFLDS